MNLKQLYEHLTRHARRLGRPQKCLRGGQTGVACAGGARWRCLPAASPSAQTIAYTSGSCDRSQGTCANIYSSAIEVYALIVVLTPSKSIAS